MKMSRINRTGAAALALAALSAGQAAAQITLTPRALGMGGAYVADARGQEALFVNPANLGLSRTPYYSVAVPQLSLGVRMSGAGVGDVPSLINFDDMAQGEKDDLLAGIPASGLRAGLDVSIPLASVSVGRFAAGVAYRVSYRETVGRDIMDLLLNGYQAGRTDYAVGETGGSHASYYDVAAAYGRKVGPVSVGVTGHYVAGRALARHRLFEPTFNLEREDIAVELRDVNVRGGSGYSVDVGLAAEPSPRLTVSAAVANVFSSFKWSEELYTRHVTLGRDDFGGDGEVIFNQLMESKERVDAGAAPQTVYETAGGLYEGAYLPATLRVGAAYLLPGEKTRVSGAFQGALDEGTLGGGWKRQLSAGAEHRVSTLVQARGGVASDLGGGWMAAGGVSLGPINLGLARTTEPGEGARAGQWIATFGLSMRSNVSLGDYDYLKEPGAVLKPEHQRLRDGRRQ
jgi:hypothetical protein